MAIQALQLVDTYDDYSFWVVLSPAGKIRSVDEVGFLQQVARPHTMEYELKLLSDDDAKLLGVYDSYKYLCGIGANIRDVTDSDITNFFDAWGVAYIY